MTNRRCKWGHELTPENTYIRPNGRRECRACKNRRHRNFRASSPEYRQREAKRKSTPEYLERKAKYDRERYHRKEPEIHRKVSAKIQRHALRKRRQRLERRSAGQLITPFGKVVRGELQKLEDQAWQSVFGQGQGPA